MVAKCDFVSCVSIAAACLTHNDSGSWHELLEIHLCAGLVPAKCHIDGLVSPFGLTSACPFWCGWDWVSITNLIFLVHHDWRQLEMDGSVAFMHQDQGKSKILCKVTAMGIAPTPNVSIKAGFNDSCPLK